MPKLIGIKDLQTNTRAIREEVAKGVHFVVIYRSKPVFEIRPISGGEDWTAEEWSNEERYALAESSFDFWKSADDDNIFDESISL